MLRVARAVQEGGEGRGGEGEARGEGFSPESMDLGSIEGVVEGGDGPGCRVVRQLRERRRRGFGRRVCVD